MKKFTIEQFKRSEYAAVCVVILFIVCISIVSLFGDRQGFVQSLNLVSAPVILGMLGLSLVNYASRAWRWQKFSRHLGLQVPIFEGAVCYVAGFSMTTTPGKIGEMLRLWMLERRYGYDYHRTFPIALGDRISDINAMLLLVMVSIVSQPEYWWGVVIAFLVVAAMTTALMWPRPAIAAVNALYLGLNRRKPDLFAKARRTLRLTASLFDWRLYGGTLVLTVVGWLAECLAFYWLLRELGLPLDFSHAVFIFSFSMLAGAASMMPGGLGGVEAVMIALLIGVDSSFETAVVATTIIRFTTLWFAVGLGFLVMPILLNLVRKQDAPAVLRR
jgi:uncharacterized membrane protein YbhN (UPF0104 family)